MQSDNLTEEQKTYLAALDKLRSGAKDMCQDIITALNNEYRSVGLTYDQMTEYWWKFLLEQINEERDESTGESSIS